MTQPWFRFYRAAVNNPKVQRLPPAEFRAVFMATLDGEDTAFSEYLRPGNDRPPAHEWRELRAAVFERDDFTCTYCGLRGVKLECDHVVPVSRGGSSEPDNLATACRPCNRAKRDMTVEEWRGAA